MLTVGRHYLHSAVKNTYYSTPLKQVNCHQVCEYNLMNNVKNIESEKTLNNTLKRESIIAPTKPTKYY